MAQDNAQIPAAKNVTNGDESRYADKGATYTKGLPHDDFGRVDLKAFASFKKALMSGKYSDFEQITVGGTRTLNDPQGGLTFDLEGLDPVQFGQPEVPPAPPMASDQARPSCSSTTGLRWCATWPSPIITPTSWWPRQRRRSGRSRPTAGRATTAAR